MQANRVVPTSLQQPYEANGPSTSRVQKLDLGHLGISSIAIDGPMGGMSVLQWLSYTPRGYARYTIPFGDHRTIFGRVYQLD